MPANAKFVYLYRDADNYKAWGSVVFRNPKRLDCRQLSERLRAAMMVDQTFVADQIGVPEVFLFRSRFATDSDHCYHEFCVIEETHESPDDVIDRAIEQFVDEVESAARQGWQGFNPLERDFKRFRMLL